MKAGYNLYKKSNKVTPRDVLVKPKNAIVFSASLFKRQPNY